jgi:cytochrome c biogenesis factor
MNLTFYFVTWIPLAVVVGVLAIYRNMVASHEDESIHVLDGDAPQVAAQVKLSHKLEVIERWGKALTAVVVVYGLVIGVLYLYYVWQQGAKLPG